jgi:hypothetical protein
VRDGETPEQAAARRERGRLVDAQIAREMAEAEKVEARRHEAAVRSARQIAIEEEQRLKAAARVEEERRQRGEGGGEDEAATPEDAATAAAIAELAQLAPLASRVKLPGTQGAYDMRRMVSVAERRRIAELNALVPPEERVLLPVPGGGGGGGGAVATPPQKQQQEPPPPPPPYSLPTPPPFHLHTHHHDQPLLIMRGPQALPRETFEQLRRDLITSPLLYRRNGLKEAAFGRTTGFVLFFIEGKAEEIVRTCPLFSFLVPFLDAVRLPDATAFVVNALRSEPVVEEKEQEEGGGEGGAKTAAVTAGAHVDNTLEQFAPLHWNAESHQTSVLYVKVPAEMRGGRLELWAPDLGNATHPKESGGTGRGKRGEGLAAGIGGGPPTRVVEPVENTIASFRGDARHRVLKHAAREVRVSLVIEQYLVPRSGRRESAAAAPAAATAAARAPVDRLLELEQQVGAPLWVSGQDEPGRSENAVLAPYRGLWDPRWGEKKAAWLMGGEGVVIEVDEDEVAEVERAGGAVVVGGDKDKGDTHLREMVVEPIDEEEAEVEAYRRRKKVGGERG